VGCPDGSARIERWFQTPDGSRLYDSTDCATENSHPIAPTLTDVANAFQHIPIDLPPLTLQPARTTIVNFPTIAYTTAGPFTRTVTLLGHQVTFHITPTAFVWRWGDGAITTTSSPGQAYSEDGLDGAITHKYEDTASHLASVSTTYAATYDLDGRPMGNVDGTVTRASAPQPIRAKTYTPVLVDR
jgi:hypothetical protein